ncbi:MAG TPA: hypothetical protein VNZ26_03160 [Vicinamibacterales bacterium]|jgi:hypothetical protein|nr:hypothetical protein [Vicinamibacterales bacterium]
MFTWRVCAIVVFLAGCGACAVDIHPTVIPTEAVSRMGELWEQPADISKADLLNGPWGADRAPNPDEKYTFLRKKRRGSNTGLTVNDSRGREWHIKQGREAEPEVVLSHVLSAVGYHQPPVYFLPSFTLTDSAGQHTERGGRFRLHDSTLKNRGEWSWDQNPFVGTPAYEGLLVILVLFNSADLKNENNTLYEVKRKNEESTSWFVVRDLGSSLGQTSRFLARINKPDVFETDGFITGVSDGYVRFAYHAKHSNLVQHRIRPEGVAWATGLLSELSDRQWHDAFAGAGYTPSVAERFIRRIHQKIEEGQQFKSR